MTQPRLDGRIHELTQADFAEEVLQSEVPVLVDFSATWCGPCKMLEPVLEGLAAEYAQRAKVVKVDIDASPDLASSYGVTAVPTLLFFKGGDVVDSSVGLAPGPRLAQKLAALL